MADLDRRTVLKVGALSVGAALLAPPRPPPHGPWSSPSPTPTPTPDAGFGLAPFSESPFGGTP